MSKKVVIIGAGIGGIATALRLSKQGYKVTLLEKNHQAGGRLNQLKKDGFTFDMGPSFFSMSYIFTEFARECNIKLPFDYHEVDPLYAVHFLNGRKYLLHKDIDKLSEQFKDIEPGFKKSFIAYLASGKMLFDSSMEDIVGKNHNSLGEYVAAMMKSPPQQVPKLFRNYYQEVSKYFKSDDVKQIMSLVAFFLGSNPFETSAVYSLLSYTEFQHDGYFNVKGGMYKIVEGMMDELKKANVEIIYNAEITGVDAVDDKVVAVVDKNHVKYNADIFVANEDAALFRGRLLGRKAFSEKKLANMKWTFAPLTIYLGINQKLQGLYHHNYFLGNNFSEYASGIFKNAVSLEKPYYYLNILSHSNPECAPQGCESLFIVCPMPDLRFKPDWSDKEVIANDIIADLSDRIGVPLKDKIVSKTIYSPIEWEKMFNLYKGSGLGLAHNLMQTGYFRPKNKDEKLKNLFYVGASTTPGTGLPMCIISSKLVTEQINKA